VSAQARIGTSGWVYPHWRGVFYPEDLPQSQWFTHYACYFDTVEINNTFYRLPQESAFDRWRDQAPEGFVYAVKASRYITHFKHLKDCAESIERLLSRARRLGGHLGPILYQLPPHWGPDPERLEAFAALLPGDLTHVFEFRNGGWFSEPVCEVLIDHQLSFCIFDLPDAECPRWVTGPTVYIRFHGADRAYGGRYGGESLAGWARFIRDTQAQGHEVYAYFNNDAFGYALADARELREIVEEDTHDGV
jgi:uncharacterized protein YecE (DUF72 family)